MAAYRPEPELAPDAPARTGVLLVNLGTPSAATAQALRPYLAQFLGDPRVIELPRAAWQPILHGVILRLRPERSAAKYRQIWSEEGSPLLVWSRKLAALLRGSLGERGHNVPVQLGMRYGEPALASALGSLRMAGCARILVVPLYPQYSATTVGTAFDAVSQWARRARVVPEMRFIHGYHDDSGYIGALASGVRARWRELGRPDRLVMSFHGVPQKMVEHGDPYERQCRATAMRLAAELELPDEQWLLTFQSRFGRARWLEPATDTTLRKLGRARTGRVDVICPGFACDCLETLEEIDIENRLIFTQAGGGEFNYLPCLNDDPAWVAALADLVQRHLQGWPTQC